MVEIKSVYEGQLHCNATHERADTSVIVAGQGKRRDVVSQLALVAAGERNPLRIRGM
jgi:hypothetical protein